LNHQKQFKKKGGMKTEVGGDETMKRRGEKNSAVIVGKSVKTYGKNEDNFEMDGDNGIGSDQTERQPSLETSKTRLSANCFIIICILGAPECILGAKV